MKNKNIFGTFYDVSWGLKLEPCHSCLDTVLTNYEPCRDEALPTPAEAEDDDDLHE